MSYEQIAKESRLKVLELVYKAKTSHIGSLLGAADIFAVLFEKMDLDKDVFVLSAGWKAALLYYHMWRKGLITQVELDSYCQEGSKWIGLAEPVHPFIKIAGGSMGLGLPSAVGIALAKKIKGEEGVVYCYMSDGELAIGTTWESALIAAHHNLENLVVIVEMNGFQAMGKTEEILTSYFPAHNWRYTTVDGHDYGALEARFKGSFFMGMQGSAPRVLFANTTKGKGWKRAENNNLYHYKQIDQEEYEEAKKELCQS